MYDVVTSSGYYCNWIKAMSFCCTRRYYIGSCRASSLYYISNTRYNNCMKILCYFCTALNIMTMEFSSDLVYSFNYLHFWTIKSAIITRLISLKLHQLFLDFDCLWILKVEQILILIIFLLVSLHLLIYASKT